MNKRKRQPIDAAPITTVYRALLLFDAVPDLSGDDSIQRSVNAANAERKIGAFTVDASICADRANVSFESHEADRDWKRLFVVEADFRRDAVTEAVRAIEALARERGIVQYEADSD